MKKARRSARPFSLSQNRRSVSGRIQHALLFHCAIPVEHVADCQFTAAEPAGGAPQATRTGSIHGALLAADCVARAAATAVDAALLAADRIDGAAATTVYGAFPAADRVDSAAATAV